MDKKLELEWILNKIDRSPDIYLLVQAINTGKEYSSRNVHEWGREHSDIYCKIRDLLAQRLYEKVADGEDGLDRQLAERELGEFKFVVGEERDYVLSDADRRMLERAGVYVEET